MKTEKKRRGVGCWGLLALMVLLGLGVFFLMQSNWILLIVIFFVVLFFSA